MNLGIILVHGYTGSPDDLEPLAHKIGMQYGQEAVINVCLPQYENGVLLPFEGRQFLDSIEAAVNALCDDGRGIVLLGHSTGGTLLLSFMKRTGFVPRLLILAGTPPRIDTGYLDRWNHYCPKADHMSLTMVASMVSLINRVFSEPFQSTFPVLILQGEQDELVPKEDASLWGAGFFSGPVRRVNIPNCGHHIFRGAQKDFAQDLVLRAICAVADKVSEKDRETLFPLKAKEPKLNRFLSGCPSGEFHILRTPGVQRSGGTHGSLAPVVSHEPIFANIEITTRCNLNCRYCARSWMFRATADMSLENFRNLLDFLPHVFRINLVGLGEPTLHPHIVKFVELATSQARKVCLVTNAMFLTPTLSQELIQAGLDAITFSVDTPYQAEIDLVRAGADFERMNANIELFLQQCSDTRRIPCAVFSAVSSQTVFSLEKLADVVADWGVDAWMLSDLNFSPHQRYTVWKNRGEKTDLAIKRALSRAFARALPVLSVRGLEELGFSHGYRDFLIFSPFALYDRSARHTWCLSPWQTLVVDVEGNVSICDCQPDHKIGNLFQTPFTEIWNSPSMVAYRQAMIGDDPPKECRICPRF